MASERKNGGPAYPTMPINTDTPEKYSGMSLRDWFAGQALAGLFAGGWKDAASSHGNNQAIQDGVGLAYQAADEMLAARHTEGEQE